MNPVPPLCPFCNSIPEVDAMCYFTCYKEDDHEFSGELKLISIDDLDKGYELTWFVVARAPRVLEQIFIIVEYNQRRYAINYNHQSHYVHYYEHQEMISIARAKQLLDKYWNMKAFL